MAVDLMATIRANRVALPWRHKSEHPSYIHITSITVFKPSVIAPTYAATKAALAHYKRSQAKMITA